MEGKKTSESYSRNSQNHMIDHKEPVKEVFWVQWGLKMKFKNNEGIYVVKASQGTGKMITGFA